jgi:nucleoside-diphosphate kinase
VLGTLDAQARENLLQGVTVDGQTANFKSIEDGGGEGANRWYRVVISEGRNREVRKLFDAVGLTVSRLIRIRYGNVVLPRGLKRGVWVDLGPDDVRRIRQLAGGARPGQAANDNAQRAGRGPQGGDRGDRGARPNDRGNRNDRGPRRDGAPARRRASDRGGSTAMRISTSIRCGSQSARADFDRRFAKNQRPFSGRAMRMAAAVLAPAAREAAPSAPERSPTRCRPSGFIGADAFHRKSGRSGGGGRQRGGQRGGGRRARALKCRVSRQGLSRASAPASTGRRLHPKLCPDGFFRFFMSLERTLSIIKPDAVAKNVIGQIYSRFENAGLKVVAARMTQLSRAQAEGFYAVHRARPFFNDLVNFMISGPVMIQALEGEGAIAKNRELMGATDPKKADKGTIRADFADSIDANAVHGSDAPETARDEIAYFFPALDVISR